MRIGLSEKTVLVALGQAAAFSESPSPQVESSSDEVSRSPIFCATFYFKYIASQDELKIHL